MFIKSLQLRGFLRFHAAATVDFSDGVTAIVGPAGCGKHDLILALRWVLSEHPVLEMQRPMPYDSKWQSPSVTLSVCDDAGVEYQLSRQLMYQEHLAHQVNGREVNVKQFEQYLRAFRPAIEVPKDAAALVTACDRTDKGKLFIVEELDKNLTKNEETDVFVQSLFRLAEHNQLLMITYSKKAMAVADTMYGVTMEKYGQAKLVGMRLTTS